MDKIIQSVGRALWPWGWMHRRTMGESSDTRGPGGANLSSIHLVEKKPFPYAGT